MITKPDDFDWVTARWKCSLEMAFQILSEIVDTNVKKINERPHPSATFERRLLNQKLIVIRKREDEISTVVFELSYPAIQVKRVSPAGAETFLFSTTPSLTEDGDCILEVEGQPLKFWQITKRALYDLFFENG